MFAIVAMNLVSLCVFIVFGYIAGKIGVITEESSGCLSDILLKIALPCTIIMSMQKPFSTELLIGGVIVLGISGIIYMSSMGIAMLLCVLLNIKIPARGVWIFAVMFPNVGYMGLPVINAVYGEGALFYASINNVVFNLLSSTLGIYIMRNGGALLAKSKEKKREKKALRDFNLLPPVTLLGFILFLFSISIPATLADALRMGASMTTPLSMIIIGGLLSRNRFRKIFAGGREYAVLAVRLLIIPVIVFLAVSPFISDALILGVLVFLSGMPVSAVTAIFSTKYKCDAFLGSKLVALSTILSLATLPVISLML